MRKPVSVWARLWWSVKAEWIKMTWHPIRDRSAEYQHLIDLAVRRARAILGTHPASNARQDEGTVV